MKFLAPAALMASLALPAAATDLNAMTDGERDIFRAEVRDYLIQHPEVLLEAMQVLRDREANAEAEQDDRLLSAYESEIFNDGKSWVGGNPDGDVTIVEFLDYRCGYCRRAHSDLSEILADDGNIRWIVKEFPILGPDSNMSSQLAIATKQVHGDDAYGRLHDVLMTFEGPVNEQTLPLIAQRAEIELEPVLPVMNSDEVAQHIAEVHELGRALNITGTPAFIVDGVMLRGYLPRDQMEAIIAEQRAEAG